MAPQQRIQSPGPVISNVERLGKSPLNSIKSSSINNNQGVGKSPGIKPQSPLIISKSKSP
jgi:hypothetical protein